MGAATRAPVGKPQKRRRIAGHLPFPTQSLEPQVMHALERPRLLRFDLELKVDCPVYMLIDQSVNDLSRNTVRRRCGDSGG